MSNEDGESSSSPSPPSSSSNSNRVYEKIQTVGKSTNIAWHKSTISKKDYNEKNGHRSTMLWFTGLSGSGKSTLANAVNANLFHRNIRTYVLDGDNVRHGLCRDLGFSAADREENIRRVGHVASLFVDAGMVVVTAFVSPFRADRDSVRASMEGKEKGDGEPDSFIEVYCKASLQVCESRDTKGLYAKAREGTLQEFTGISSPYEVPEAPELTVETGTESLEDCVDQVVSYLESRGVIKPVNSL